jgi:Alr-MurF fusion protein
MLAKQAALPAVIVTHIVYDSRRILSPEGALFIALQGSTRSGNDFIPDAYEKGVRLFVVKENSDFPRLEGAAYLEVTSPLLSLQKLAAYHRQRFTYPVVGITGSVGKTTFKEWAWHMLSPKLRVIRSPKSFNSQLGVALSLLELHENADVALIEAGISEPGEMERLQKMILPTFGILTAFGQAHRRSFSSEEEHLSEKLKLFKHAVMTFVSSSVDIDKSVLAKIGGAQPEFHGKAPDWITGGYSPMLGLLEKLGQEFDLSEEEITRAVDTLPQLALRLEILQGTNGNTIINDTYSLDPDGLREALHKQQQIAGGRPKVVVLGLADRSQQTELGEIIAEFNTDRTIILEKGAAIPWESICDSVVLVKSNRSLGTEGEVNRGRLLSHTTVVEIDLSAIRHNVNYFREKLDPQTKILCMVKASSYGSGAERVAAFLQNEKIDYFGVAFADEGVALRNAGVTLPVVVMNPDPEHTVLILRHNLEPAIYSFDQLDNFVSELIRAGISGYPVHLKFDTGMHRLGFDPEDRHRLLETLRSQPEIVVKGIYSHLADADNPTDGAQTQAQIASFGEIVSFFGEQLEYTFIAHLANSAGALNYPAAQLDMIRLGIVLYGYGAGRSAADLRPAVKWRSAVSQVKTVRAGECIGYGCSEKLESDTEIAVIPVGYADGFRRSLGNGKGSVVIRGRKCRTVGRVCMDMVMVDVSGLCAMPGDEAEIIGEVQTMDDLAAAMETIPYEVMTGLSSRMYRIYTEE